MKIQLVFFILFLITHSQWEAYMDLVENSGGGGRQEIGRTARNVINLHIVM